MDYKLVLKLAVHKEEKRVLFAEADSNFVDTLFSIMTLPMATVVRRLRNCSDNKVKVLGSLNNLYNSLSNLPDKCLSTEEIKQTLLNTRTSAHDYCIKLELNIDDAERTQYYVCIDWDCSRRPGANFSTIAYVRCNLCGKTMTRICQYEELTAATRGNHRDVGVFVSDVTTFIVTDDLRVMPNTSGNIIQLLSAIGITDTSQIAYRNFDIGVNQMRSLLEGALLMLKNPLTYMVYSSTQAIILRQAVMVKPSSAVLTASMTLKVMLQKSTSKLLFAEANSDFAEFVFGFLEIPLGTLVGKLMNGNTSYVSLDNLYKSISNLTVGEFIKSYDLKDMLINPKLVSAKFMVTDDLVIRPLSSTSTIDMLSKFKVPLNDVEEHTVNIGYKECLKILEASLISSSTLTDALVEKIIQAKK
ncbi:hypothetical protein CTI12_AA117040 [Artemisia annua]|uniref:Uncharacterized protein n=1 Tax=Artemisia annua TaxID=35608 RepID=A0A2U1PSV3_ARTAN|nr:hypothetical protein CTI12_AA117040 [Artemisia annua]